MRYIDQIEEIIQMRYTDRIKEIIQKYGFDIAWEAPCGYSTMIYAQEVLDQARHLYFAKKGRVDFRQSRDIPYTFPDKNLTKKTAQGWVFVEKQ